MDIQGFTINNKGGRRAKYIFFFIRIKRNELEEMNESRREILVESEKWIGK